MLVSSHCLLTGLFPPVFQSLHVFLPPNLRASAPQANPLLRAQWLPHLVFEFLSQRKVWPVLWKLTWDWGAHNILGREGLQITQLCSKGSIAHYFSFSVAPQKTRSGCLIQYHPRKVCILGLGDVSKDHLQIFSRRRRHHHHYHHHRHPRPLRDHWSLHISLASSFPSTGGSRHLPERFWLLKYEGISAWEIDSLGPCFVRKEGGSFLPWVHGPSLVCFLHLLTHKDWDVSHTAVQTKGHIRLYHPVYCLVPLLHHLVKMSHLILL